MVGYGLAALAWLALAGLLGARGAGRGPGRWLLGATFAEAAWAATLAAQAAGLAPTAAVSAAEALRPLAWTLMLAALLRAGVTAVRPGPAGPTASHPPGADGSTPGPALHGVPAIALGLAALSIAADSTGGVIPGHPAEGIDLLAAVLVLVCVEQLYRLTDPVHRWAVKDLCLAVGAAAAFDLLLGANALRTGTADAGLWAARGFAHALVAPLVAVSAARNRDWRLRIKVSRGVVGHSVALLASSALVLGSLALGAAARFAGPDWERVVQAVSLFAAGTGAVAMIGSRGLRSRARIALAKHFFSYRYDYRAEWLHLTRLLSLPEDGDADRLGERALRALCDLVDSPGGTLWIATPHGSFVRDPHASEAERPALRDDEAMVDWLRTRGWVVELDQWRREPGRYDGLVLPPALAGDPRAWMILPLLQQQTLVGIALLDRPRGAPAIDWEVRDLMKTAGRQVAGTLALRSAGERLAQAGRFESFNRMSAFVAHDLKTLVAQLSLMLRNADRHAADPLFRRDMLETVEHVIGRMQGLMRELGGVAAAGATPCAAIAVAPVLAAAVRTRGGLAPAPVLEPVDPSLADCAVRADAQRLERVLGHLVQNAVEATPIDGRVAVRLRADAAQVLIEVADSGHGMSAEFVERRLFRPFASTKGHGLGLGTFECSEYLHELGGRLEVRTAPGQGTTFIARLPRARAPAPLPLPLQEA